MADGGPVGDPADAHAKRARVGFDGDGDECEIAVAPGEFLESEARAVCRYGKACGNDHLIRLPRGGEHTGLKLGRAHHALASLRAQHHHAAKRRQAERQLRTRVRKGERAAHRAFVARLKMAEPGQRQAEQRHVVRKLRPIEQPALRGSRTDLEHAVLHTDVIERLEARDIHQNGWLREPHIEDRHERLSARQNARVVTRFGEQVKRLLHGFGADVIERRGLHRANPRRRSSRRRNASAWAASPPPVARARRSKNWPINRRAAPSSMRPPTDATLPPTPAS